MKKILFILIIISVFIIYSFNKNNSVYFLDINSSTSLYNSYIVNNYNIDEFNFDFNNRNYRITDVINLINNNVCINNKCIMQELVKASFITINVGYNDYSIYKENDILNDYESLFKTLRNITKEKILLIGLYDLNIDDNLIIINNSLNTICNKYDIIYIDILSSINEDILYNFSDSVLIDKYIGEKIMENI